MAWARENGHVVLTHDLDFGTLLALTRANGPSVVQVRAQDVLPQHLEVPG
jgi:predicted nuclease of predicted toxin-antitoxin system